MAGKTLEGKKPREERAVTVNQAFGSIGQQLNLRRADTDRAVSKSSGREPDSRVKRRAVEVVTRPRLRGEPITQRGGATKDSRGRTR
jgi:hypothetical protein